MMWELVDIYIVNVIFDQSCIEFDNIRQISLLFKRHDYNIT